MPWVSVLASHAAGSLLTGSVHAARVEVISTTSGAGPVLEELEPPNVDPPSDPLLVELESAAVSVGSSPSLVDDGSNVVTPPLELPVADPESESVAGTDVTDDIESLPRVDDEGAVDVPSSGVTQAPESDPCENSP